MPTLSTSNSGTITTLHQLKDPMETALIPTPTAHADHIVCNGCKQPLEQTSDSVVVSFGQSLWHVDCLYVSPARSSPRPPRAALLSDQLSRCAKCAHLVEHDTNLLLLSDGSPVCENCSYICSVCFQPISNEAIVTGDESYHADCFRCRSCSNKIEELIFAKTSQGIWCMACHNERVARSRKHAEAKRSRSQRKEKEAALRGGRRERDKEGGEFDLLGLEGGLSSAASTGTFDSIGTSHASPRGTSSSRDISSTLGMGTHSPSPRRPRTSPPALDGSPSGHGLSSGASSHSIAALARPTAPRSLNLSPSRTLQESGRAASDPHDLPSNASMDIGGRPTPTRSTSSPLSPTFAASSPRSSMLPPSSSTATGLNSGAERTSRQGSLSAPSTDKGSNRRSGFYGAMAKAASSEDAGSNSSAQGGLEGKDEEENERPAKIENITQSPSFDSGYERTEVLDGNSNHPSTAEDSSLSADLHNSISFYDPDTLLFLDHVTSSAGAPDDSSLPALPSGATHNKSLSRRSQSYKNGVALMGLSGIPSSTYPTDDVPTSPTSSTSSHRLSTEPKSEISRKVRESIRRSRGEAGADPSGLEGEGMGLDVEMVEMLLGELDKTKNEMRELVGVYNDFRRVSRTAFEGFSLARDEYDKELQQRRLVESRMETLKQTFQEQAVRLALGDRERALGREERELSAAVELLGRERDKLSGECEMRVLELEVLNSAGTDGVEQIPGQLAARLDEIKVAHRAELDALHSQKEDLRRQVRELEEDRGRYTDEMEGLQRTHTTLREETERETRVLDDLKDNLGKLRLGEGTTAGAGAGRAMGAPPASLAIPRATPTLGAVSSGSPLRSAAPSPVLPDADDMTLYLSRPTTATSTATISTTATTMDPTPPPSKKFKWGKPSVPSRTPLVAARPLPSPFASLATTPYSSTSGAGREVRTHAWAQVSILRPVKCDWCGDKMWGLNEVRCTVCGTYTHAKCANYLTTKCSAHAAPELEGPGASGVGGAGAAGAHVMFGSDLTLQATIEGRQVPLVVSKCIAAVESYGMNYEGVYRKSGGNGQTKLITQHFERGTEFDLNDLDKFNDLAAVTSCMKNFFRSLPDPLFTHSLHENFVSCTELLDEETKLHAVEQTLHDLPEVHFYTARMLIGHLHRVHLQSGENKMTPANLGVVFGPTVLRSRDPSREFSDMGSKAKLVELLVENYPRLFSQSYPLTHSL